MPLKKKRERRTPLTPAQIEYLMTGKTDDPDVFLDWAYRDIPEIQAAFDGVRSDYPTGHFAWAEKSFGAKR